MDRSRRHLVALSGRAAQTEEAGEAEVWIGLEVLGEQQMAVVVEVRRESMMAGVAEALMLSEEEAVVR
jgi:hypothetical protein